MVGDVAAAPPTGNSAAHEPVAAFPSGDSAIHEVVAATAAPSPVPSGNSATREPIAVSPWGEPLFDGGFSLPMVHWNAPTSPLRDPTITTLDLFTDEIKRASSVTEASISSEKMLVPFRSLRSLYLVHLRIGGPLDRISSRYLMFDTGSDLSWTQCTPCSPCSRGHYPPYNPSRSSKFRSVSCDDPLCEHAYSAACYDSHCIFVRFYGDGSTSSGYLVLDTFHFT